MLSNLSKLYPQQFPKYKQLEERRLKVDGVEAAEVVFTYKNPRGYPVKQHLLIVMKDNEYKMFYIAAQIPENKYDDLSDEVDDLFNSVVIY